MLLGSGNGRQLLDALGEARKKSGVPVLVKELTAEENGMCFPNRPQPDNPFEDEHPLSKTAGRAFRSRVARCTTIPRSSRVKSPASCISTTSCAMPITS
ncbi:hypothetical protein QNM99_29445 [Pseudomonas sp. PCH446]